MPTHKPASSCATTAGDTNFSREDIKSLDSRFSQKVDEKILNKELSENDYEIFKNIFLIYLNSIIQTKSPEKQLEKLKDFKKNNEIKIDTSKEEGLITEYSNTINLFINDVLFDKKLRPLNGKIIDITTYEDVIAVIENLVGIFNQIDNAVKVTINQLINKQTDECKAKKATVNECIAPCRIESKSSTAGLFNKCRF
jgi:hypothetical protein